MANQGAKKRKEENARHMKNLLYVIIISNVVFLVIRAGFMYSTFKWKHAGGLLLTAFAYIIPYQQLYAMSMPSYGEDGELIDGGFDMSTGGICGYLHDVIYITSFVQLASIFSEKFWYIYLVVYLASNLLSLASQSDSCDSPCVFQKWIPAFAAYKLFGLVKGFLPSGSEGPEEDEKTRRKREKMEKRASRGKFVKTRAR